MLGPNDTLANWDVSGPFVGRGGQEDSKEGSGDMIGKGTWLGRVVKDYLQANRND